jgi:hypothetical protein
MRAATDPAQAATPQGFRVDGCPGKIMARAFSAQDRVDKMPADLRACVHAYGSVIVEAFVNYGVCDPRYIHALVATVRHGSRSGADRSTGHGAEGLIDAFLVQSGSGETAASLVRHLWQCNLAIVSRDGSPAAIEASIEAIRGMPLMKREEKHKRRFRAAVHAAAVSLFPWLAP